MMWGQNKAIRYYSRTVVLSPFCAGRGWPVRGHKRQAKPASKLKAWSIGWAEATPQKAEIATSMLGGQCSGGPQGITSADMASS